MKYITFSTSHLLRKMTFALFYLTLLMGGNVLFGQTNFSQSIDSLLQTQKIRPFNGIVLISKNGKMQYQKAVGFANFETKEKLNMNQQFVIGSISKQITVVLILRAFDQGKLKLDSPIRTYLPNLKPNWADTVTIHHLLNHTSGIVDVDSPLAFRAGSEFSYSGLGYKLLGEIIEKVENKPLEKVVNELFSFCKMKHSTYPSEAKQKQVIQGYSHQQEGKIEPEKGTFQNNYAAAGLYISNPKDILKWNNLLHNGKLLKPETYQKMISPSSLRNHPLWGEVGYGYGLQITKREGNLMEIGHSGYVVGFVSNNFYYPESKTSVIVMENLDWKDEISENNFYFESEIAKIMRSVLRK